MGRKKNNRKNEKIAYAKEVGVHRKLDLMSNGFTITEITSLMESA